MDIILTLLRLIMNANHESGDLFNIPMSKFSMMFSERSRKPSFGRLMSPSILRILLAPRVRNLRPRRLSRFSIFSIWFCNETLRRCKHSHSFSSFINLCVQIIINIHTCTSLLFLIMQSYCCSWFGCQTCDINCKYAKKINTSWNTGVRRVLGIPHRTHTASLS